MSNFSLLVLHLLIDFGWGSLVLLVLLLILLVLLLVLLMFFLFL